MLDTDIRSDGRVELIKKLLKYGVVKFLLFRQFLWSSVHPILFFFWAATSVE